MYLRNYWNNIFTLFYVINTVKLYFKLVFGKIRANAAVNCVFKKIFPLPKSCFLASPSIFMKLCVCQSCKLCTEMKEWSNDCH